jgi:hypothetical protein
LAYAKQRHKAHGNELQADLNGICELRKWWFSRRWPEPLSVRFEGVVLEADDVWAAKAMNSAIQNQGETK